jgi:hypothetical protein
MNAEICFATLQPVRTRTVSNPSLIQNATMKKPRLPGDIHIFELGIRKNNKLC